MLKTIIVKIAFILTKISESTMLALLLLYIAVTVLAFGFAAVVFCIVVRFLFVCLDYLLVAWACLCIGRFLPDAR